MDCADHLSGRSVAAVLVPSSATLKEATEHMQHEAALIVNDDGRLCGLITDGDLRRSFLQGADQASPVSAIMTREPFTVPVGVSAATIRAELLGRGIRHLPEVDAAGRPVAIHLLKDHLLQLDQAGAVIMAGGQGTRLRPLTLATPKPLLRVGVQPILDTILDGLRRRGVGEVVLTVNYLREQIKDHVGDGSTYGLRITYVEEEQQLGTAGALALLAPRPSKAFLVMNGDLFTDLDFQSFIQFHRDDGNDLSVCVRPYEVQIPYGVVTICPATRVVEEVVEKPCLRHLVNAGIYMMEPRLIDLVPAGQPYDMVSLIRQAKAAGHRVGAFPILEYWCDIGQHRDMQAAHEHWYQHAATEANRAAAMPAAAIR